MTLRQEIWKLLGNLAEFGEQDYITDEIIKIISKYYISKKDFDNYLENTRTEIIKIIDEKISKIPKDNLQDIRVSLLLELKQEINEK
ncbi:MAG: hypothetical protein R3321_13540 [Nitrososphaeraceae archaeon]|nr:hypothetical protein [Nitrososphaeraceae archaeon]